MRRSRSMSNRGEIAVDNRPRSMYNRGVDPPPRRIARSMPSSTHKRKYPLMPLPDLRRPLSSCKETSALLKKQHQDVREYVKGRQNEGPRPCTIVDYSQMRCYEKTWPKHTLDTEMVAAFSLGVICPDGPPKLRNKTSQQEAEFLDFEEMNKAGDRLVAALSMPRYHHVVEDINLELAQDFQDKHLKLLRTTNITDDSLVTIGNVYHVLESLVITRCDHVTDAGVIAVAVGCTQLKFLSLCGIPGVTDRCLETLSKISADTLITLDVDYCIGIERRSQEELLHLFPNLQCD